MRMLSGVCVAAVETAARVVVLDAGPLIHLDELDSLALLDDYKELLVPAAVWLEVERHRPSLFRTPGLNISRVTPNGSCSPALVALSRLYPAACGRDPGPAGRNRTWRRLAVYRRYGGPPRSKAARHPCSRNFGNSAPSDAPPAAERFRSFQLTASHTRAFNATRQTVAS